MPGKAVLFLAPLVYLVLFHGLGRYGLVNGDEGFYHDVAVRMVETRDFFHLDFQGEHRLYDTFMNAPLQYWGRALAISLLGDGPVAMRIESASFGLASLWLTAVLARRLAGRRVALLAAAIQLTTFQFVYWHSARTGELETATAFFLTAVVAAFLRYLETGRGLVLHHVLWVLLANWKLPLVLVPLLAELVAFALLPAARARFVPWLRAALWVLPLGFSWHIVQFLVHWEGFVAVMTRMLAQAGGGAAEGLSQRLGTNASFYGFAVLYGAFPYSLLYPFSLGAMLYAARGEARLRWAVVALFVAAVFVFFLCVAKHYRWYWTPAIPLLSLAVAAWLDGLARARPGPAALAAAGVVFAGLLLVDVDLFGANPFAARTPYLPLVLPLRSLVEAPVAAAAFGLFGVGAALAVAVRTMGGARAGAVLAGGMLAVCFAFGLLRVLSPLQHLDHQTEMVRVRAHVDAAHQAGRSVPTPIAIAEGGELKVRALFARDFEIVPGRGDVAWWLFEPQDPRAKGSIRRGLSNAVTPPGASPP
jgi:4-amino-4-deoxy-L-arabinose transferase-like glycosyltransferase